MKGTKFCPKTNNICAGVCGKEEIDVLPLDKSFLIDLPGETKWIRVESVPKIYEIFRTMKNDMKYMLVAGHTSHGNETAFVVKIFWTFLHRLTIISTIWLR